MPSVRGAYNSDELAAGWCREVFTTKEVKEDFLEDWEAFWQPIHAELQRRAGTWSASMDYTVEG
jgi:Zn/Cd-binding protein ZinT